MKITYRAGGKEVEAAFDGRVGVWTGGLQSIDVVEAGERLDLRHVPVVRIGGKAKHQEARVQEFLKSSPDFRGAFLLKPGAGNWDMGLGYVILMSREILQGRRVSGGQPQAGYVNHRWTAEGRYLADRAMLLHGRVVQELAQGVEVEPGIELLVKKLCANFGELEGHPLQARCSAVLQEAYALEDKRIAVSSEERRDLSVLLQRILIARMPHVRKISDFPGDLAISVADIDRGLLEEGLGTVVVPGLGRREVERRFAVVWVSGEYVPSILLTWAEVDAVRAWPAGIYPMVDGVELNGGASSALAAETDEERWGNLKIYLQGRRR